MGRRKIYQKWIDKFMDKHPIVAAFVLSLLLFVSTIILITVIGFNWFTIFCLGLAIMLLIIGIIMAIRYQKKRKRKKKIKQKLDDLNVEEIDRLLPYEFEDWLTDFLNENGFNAEHTRYSGDFGADIIAIRGGIKYAISCKKYSNGLGVRSVQEIIAAMDYYHADTGWVVSTAPYFTSQAYELAKTRHVKLFTKNELLEKLSELKNKQSV